MTGGNAVKIFLDLRCILPGMSGVGISARLLTEALLTHTGNHEFAAVFLRGNVPDSFAAAPNFEAVETDADYEHHPAGELWLNTSLLTLVRQSGADLLHGPAFLIPWRKTPFRKIVTIQDLIAFRLPATYPLKFRKYLQWMTRLSARSADRIIVPSENTRRDLVDTCGIDPAKIDVVPYYAHSRFKPLSEQQQGKRRSALGLPAKYLLCVAALERRKNHLTLIEAFEILKTRTDLPHKLILVGQPGYNSRKILRKISSSRFAKDIIHFPHKSQAELCDLYACAELFIFPSFYEGFGLPILEAMASGTPVIAADTSCLPEVVGEAGILVQPDSAPVLAEALMSLLRDSERLQSLREKGLKRAAQFSPERTASLTISAYEKALSVGHQKKRE